MPESKGPDVVSKLNGHEMMGRQIKVDLSKPRDRNRGNNSGGKPGGNSGGKSSRELRALAEEEADAKKKKRRPKKEWGSSMSQLEDASWLVIDGYEDEPAAFGVPPYVGFHIR